MNIKEQLRLGRKAAKVLDLLGRCADYLEKAGEQCPSYEGPEYFFISSARQSIGEAQGKLQILLNRTKQP